LRPEPPLELALLAPSSHPYTHPPTQPTDPLPPYKPAIRRAQARSYDEAAAASLVGWYFSNAHTRALSHPLPVMRAREIDRFAQSEEYFRLLESHGAGGSPTAFKSAR